MATHERVLAVVYGAADAPEDAPAAYASWSAVPEPVTRGDAEAQATACLAYMRLGETDGEVAGALRFDDLVPVVSERRGDWTYTLLIAEGGGENASATCLLPLDPNFHEVSSTGGEAGGIVPWACAGPDALVRQRPE